VIKISRSKTSHLTLQEIQNNMKKKLPLIFLILILFLAAFLRLYHISDYMTFLGDEGRDVLVAKDMLEGHLTLLGPRSSAGDFFMGPAYYYMITPFLWLFRLDPVGPAVMVALFGIATVFLVYFVGKKFFDERTGLFAAALYTVSPIVISYSHSSWNPNVLPFFSLLMIYMLYKGVETKLWKYFVIAGFLLGISLQLHYLALFLGVVVAVYVLCHSWRQTRNPSLIASHSWIPAFARMTKKNVKLLIKQYSQVLLGFAIGFSPFLAFEARHEFLNTKAILSFIFEGPKGLDVHSTPFFVIVGDVFFRVFAKLVFFFPPQERYELFNPAVLTIFAIAVVAVSIAAVISLFFIKNKSVRLLLSLWLVLGILLFGLYKKSIYDYHFAFLFPLPFLLVGNLLSKIYETKKRHVLMAGLSLVLFGGVFLYNLYAMPFRSPPNRQRDQVKTISEFIISKTDNKPYNFALITGGNSDHAYRYYLDVLGHKPVGIDNLISDPQRKSVTGQLLIVCEDTNCQPLGHPGFEVAGFGRAEIAGKWDVSVVKIYKLVPYKEVEK
jgi:4-amino-4-deoxy-L-arabinose transferase-like glycosyltransferase